MPQLVGTIELKPRPAWTSQPASRPDCDLAELFLRLARGADLGDEAPSMSVVEADLPHLVADLRAQHLLIQARIHRAARRPRVA